MTDKGREDSHTVAIKGGLRIEILENSDFLAYGPKIEPTASGYRGNPGTHHVIFIVGGEGVERLYSAQIRAEIADGPTSDLIDHLLNGINTPDVKFLKRFNVVIR